MHLQTFPSSRRLLDTVKTEMHLDHAHSIGQDAHVELQLLGMYESCLYGTPQPPLITRPKAKAAHRLRCSTSPFCAHGCQRGSSWVSLHEVYNCTSAKDHARKAFATTYKVFPHVA